MRLLPTGRIQGRPVGLDELDRWGADLLGASACADDSGSGLGTSLGVAASDCDRARAALDYQLSPQRTENPAVE
jgi:hypothetical protein